MIVAVIGVLIKMKNKEIEYLDFGERYVELDRPMLRPNVSITGTLAFLTCAELAFLLISILGAFAVREIFGFDVKLLLLAALINCVIVVLVSVIFLDRILIKAVLLYQRYASYSVRERCTFVPSCSDYFILSIKKYGAIKGALKGINRLRRCGQNEDVTEDWP